MQILSVTEFAGFCRKARPECYIYSTENQQGSRDGFLTSVSRYDEMFISLKPEVICFKNNSSSLVFECVKRVEIDTDERNVGVVFNIICGDKNNSRSDISYTMIAD